jgi:[acyl-carrier-protein] S-malonyltransferase
MSFFAVFPGQGSQYVGMGKELYENFAWIGQLFEEASEAISTDLKKLCFEGPASDLKQTENTQPCLLVVSLACFRIFQKEYGYFPQAVAGHSLGEYTALVVAGSLDLATCVRWVKARGKWMQEAVAPGEGGMAAILGLEPHLVERLCQQASEETQKVLEPANYNTQGQIVIAGAREAIEKASDLVKLEPLFHAAKIVVLEVSAPFHCKLMRPAREAMQELFEKSGYRPVKPLCPYVPNRTARLSEDPGQILPRLVEQIDHPVLWEASISHLLESWDMALEFGPGKVLSGMIKRIASHAGKTCSLGSVQDIQSLKASAQAIQNLKET